MKVLFLYFTDPPRQFSSSVAALAAVVRSRGHEPQAMQLHRRSSIADAAWAVEAAQPDVLAVSAMTRDWPGAHALLCALPSRATRHVVVGGYHASMLPADVGRCPRVDSICIGEGERPLGALLDRLAQGARPQTGPGLWVRDGEQWSDAVPGSDPERDIARLPAWDYDVFGRMREILLEGINTFGSHVDSFLPTRAGRGCPFTCAYCSAPRWNDVAGFRRDGMRNTRPVHHLCAEHSDLRQRYEPAGFEFWDEHFPVDLDWLRELAREYPRRVGLPFKVEMHPNAATRDRLELLVEAGCVLLHCGIEAGDEDLRRRVLNRRTRDERLQKVFDDARSLGLKTSASLMTLLPGETREQAKMTVDLLGRLRPDSFMWSTYQPLPGTVLGDAAVSKWPAPAGDHFDDYPKIDSRTPARQSEEEIQKTFHDLAEVHRELLDAAGDGAAPAAPARPVAAPVATHLATPALAALLGLQPPGTALTSEARLNSAVPEGDAIAVEIESVGLSPHLIRIGPLDGSPHYTATDHLALAYRGKDAPAALLRTLDGLAQRIRSVAMDDLRRALEGT